MGHFGFSYIGVILLLMLMIPNVFWAKNQPKGYSNENENKFLLTLERIGEILVTSCAVFFTDFNINKITLWSFWLLATFFFMICYEIWWIRYFKSDKNINDFYASFFGIPVGGATLPVIAFLLLSIYGKVIWMLISVVILGIGHIGIHLEHRSKINN